MSADRVIIGASPVARSVLGDLPYLDIPLLDGHEPIAVGVSAVPRNGMAHIDESILQLPDRTLTPGGMSAPASAGELRIGDGTVVMGAGDDLSTTPMRTIALGAAAPGGQTLAQAVAHARASRLVHVRRRDFQSSIDLARTTLALAGAGCVPVLSSTDLETISERLHPSLIASLGAIDPDTIRSDPLQWSAASVGLRRNAWLHHDRLLATDGVTWSLRPRRPPSISALLATNRPAYVARALEQIRRQDHPHVEVVVALHGVSDESCGAADYLREHAMEGHVIEVGESVPIGAVLNAAADRASGDILSKWDDDDRYGEHHLSDLALTMRQTGAEMVGKHAEFVHFEHEHRTIVRGTQGQERPSLSIAGGTITMARLAFDAVGGFPPVPQFEDHYIKQAFHSFGMTVYRTHGFGFAYVRHGSGQAWMPEAGYFDRNAEREWSGLPAICDVMELE